MSRFLKVALAAAAALASASSASATQYIVNGDFSQTSATTSRQLSSNNGATQYVNGWYNASDGNTAGYNFIVLGNQGTQVDGIQNNSTSNNKLYFWSKMSDAAGAASNGFALSNAIGGSGGNYLAADGAFQTAFIYQVITGLTAGQQYDLSFNWAGAQQHGYSGDTTDAWNVFFGTTNSYQSFSTGAISNVSHGFTGWRTATTTFTATGATQTLAFLAKGTPEGVPPFSLLDDVSLTEHSTGAVPEPATWAMMIGGFGLVGATLRRRRPVNGSLAA